MPWCEGCEKYWTPSAMNDDGSCPRCGADLESAAVGEEGVGADDDIEKAPWHFKLMIVALVVYLVWRFGSMIVG